MKGLLSSELRKVATTSTFYWLLVGAVAFSLLAVSSLSGVDDAQLARPVEEQLFLFLGTFVKVGFLILGIRVITDEFRFGTANPTFLFTPARSRVLLAKVGAAALFGFLIALAAQLVLFGSAAAFFTIKGEVLNFGREGYFSLLGGLLVGPIWAIVGLGIGALIRNQVIAIVAVVVWVMGLEDVIGSRLGDGDRFLPGRGGLNLALAPDGRTLWLGLVTLSAYAVIAVISGGIALRRRDVS